MKLEDKTTNVYTTSEREFGRCRMIGSTALTLEPRPEYPYLRGEGMNINFDVYRGSYVDAGLAEASIKRLYEHIERLTEAHEEHEK